MRTNAPCAWQGSVASFLAAPEEQLLSCLTSYVLDNREFVRDMKKIIHDHRVRTQTAPRERVVVFDEAQRAWDHDRVLKKHRGALTDGEPTLPAQIASHVKRRNPGHSRSGEAALERLSGSPDTRARRRGGVRPTW